MNWFTNLFKSKTTEIVTEDELILQYNDGYAEGFIAGQEFALQAVNAQIDTLMENMDTLI